MDSIPLLRILCISGAFLPFYTMYQNLILSRGRSTVYMWCTILLIVAQVLFMVSVYTIITILWLLVWQYFANKEIGIRLQDILKDISPYLLVSVAVMVITYLITLWIHSLIILLLARVVIAVSLYYIVMKMGGSQTLKECLNYFHRKKG